MSRVNGGSANIGDSGFWSSSFGKFLNHILSWFQGKTNPQADNATKDYEDPTVKRENISIIDRGTTAGPRIADGTELKEGVAPSSLGDPTALAKTVLHPTSAYTKATPTTEPLRKSTAILKTQENAGMKISTELAAIQSSRSEDVFMPQKDCLATDYARISAKIIVDDKGNADKGALTSLLEGRKREKGLIGTTSSVHDALVTKMLKRIQRDLWPSILSIKAPLDKNSGAAMLIRITVGKHMDDEVTDADARRAAIICLLDELYQEDISGVVTQRRLR